MCVTQRAISSAVSELGLQSWPSQMEKVKQLHDQLLVRHGVMLVGPTGGGKTAVRNILQKSLTLVPAPITDNTLSRTSATTGGLASSSAAAEAKKMRVDAFVINPKCVRLGELYGETDVNTFEWSDGLIASATRKFAQAAAPAITSHKHEVSLFAALSKINSS
jgi:dynein heavy chain